MTKKPISPVVRGRLPSFVKSEFPVFERYMMDYFKHLEEDGNFLNIVESWRHNTEPSNLVEPYIGAILADLGWTWEGEISVPKTVLLNTLRDFYMSRGTKQSFKYLFTVLFNQSVEIEYPRDRMFVTSQANYAEEFFIYSTAANHNSNSFKAITNLFKSRESVSVRGLISGTTVAVESIRVIVSGDKVYLKMGITNPIVSFVVKEDVRIESGDTFVIEKLHNILEVNITNAGAGCVVGDQISATPAGLSGMMTVSGLDGAGIDALTIVNPGQNYVVGEKIIAVKDTHDNGSGFYAVVTSVNGTGGITGIEILDKGRGYQKAPTIRVKTSIGTGATVVSAATKVGAIKRIKTIQPFVDFDPANITLTGPGGSSFTAREASVFVSYSHIDRVGFLGENCTLTDSNRFQQFSYDVVSAVPGSSYNAIVEDLLHPAGYVRTNVTSIELDGDRELTTSASSKTEAAAGTVYMITKSGKYIASTIGKNLTPL